MKDHIAVFISSKQVEFETERAVLADEIRAIPFLEPVLATEWSPQRRAVQELFLEQVRQAPIYVGLFHRIYSEPTEMEYRAALDNPYREILIYIKRSVDSKREPALLNLILELKNSHVVVEFNTIEDLLLNFTNHLRSALSRMIALLQKLGEGPPTGRAHDSILARRWERQSQELQKLGFPTDPDEIAALVLHLSNALQLLPLTHN